jgi:arylsulfatase A-like enzyme
MMALITELGLDDDTIFVFISDNGPLNGTHQGLAGTDCAFFNSNEGLRDGKGTLYEGGIRSPGIVRWKGRSKPGVSATASPASKTGCPRSPISRRQGQGARPCRRHQLRPHAAR